MKSCSYAFICQLWEPKKIRKGFPSAGGLLIKVFSATTLQGKKTYRCKSDIKIKNNCTIITFIIIYSFSPLGIIIMHVYVFMYVVLCM